MPPKDLVRKTYDIKVLDKRKDGGRILINTASVDRDHDRVFPGGGRTENYLKNPVVQWGHNYRDPWSTIGKTNSLDVGEDGIVADFTLRPAANDQDPQSVILLLWNGDWVRTSSIGFIPSAGKPNDVGGTDYTEWELLEWSIVPIPANQDALRLAVKGLDKSDWGKKEPRVTRQAVRKSPACRQDGESVDECVARKLPEIRDENPDMSEEQCAAMAHSMCETACGDKALAAKLAQRSARDKASMDMGPMREEMSGMEDDIESMRGHMETMRQMIDGQDEGAGEGNSPEERAAVGFVAKRGRVLSAKNEDSLRGAQGDIDAAKGKIDGVLQQLDEQPVTDDNSKMNAIRSNASAKDVSDKQVEQELLDGLKSLTTLVKEVIL